MNGEPKRRPGLAMPVLDDIKIGPLNKKFHEAMKEFVRNTDLSPKHYRCSTGWVNDILHDGLKRSQNNKEDTMMSGNAYFCDSCRGTFPRDEVWGVFLYLKKLRRDGKELQRDKVDDVGNYICDKCYAKYRKAVKPFNFPWDEWRKGDDDE